VNAELCSKTLSEYARIVTRSKSTGRSAHDTSSQ